MSELTSNSSRSTGHMEVSQFLPIEVPGHIPEQHLKLMFPYTYFVYRVIVATLRDPDQAGVSLKDAMLLADYEKWADSFKAFLMDIGTVPEDFKKVH